MIAALAQERRRATAYFMMNDWGGEVY